MYGSAVLGNVGRVLQVYDIVGVVTTVVALSVVTTTTTVAPGRNKLGSGEKVWLRHPDVERFGCFSCIHCLFAIQTNNQHNGIHHPVAMQHLSTSS
ncbi:uncharacterized protein LOC108740171 isoform X2 [Agrilus planipennis]|uniref:Uncharacterized protein LOC108740171 isoform X2 n=1 Tax=Agrilus planipennis TaxID=224129 RepID=A0A1W4X1B4_AGRPL|nr:uncharacterized protein LOC108740171 isoform X2 [Agrilus planipennis]